MRRTDARDPRSRSMAQVGYAFAVVMLGTTMPTPMYTLYAAELGFSIGMSTAIFAMYAAGVVAALILFGRWSDVLGRRPLLMAGLAFSAASSLVFLTAGSVWQLLLGRALSGLSAGICRVRRPALEPVPHRHRHRLRSNRRRCSRGVTTRHRLRRSTGFRTGFYACDLTRRGGAAWSRCRPG
ncbi:MFS transporter [Nocardia gamkensis]